MDPGIAGRVCVVTGADRGIGAASARLLRAEDAKVLLVAPEAGPLADAAEGLDGGEDEVATLPLDPTAPDAGEQMLGAALEAFGGIDVLVNSGNVEVEGGTAVVEGGTAVVEGSGAEGEGAPVDDGRAVVPDGSAAPPRDVFAVPDADWRAQYERIVIAPLRAMQAIAPAMAERGWGRIVNVCSPAGRRPSSLMPDYSVAQAAELALSRLFADRFGKQGVLVNAVCPSASPGAGATAENIAAASAGPASSQDSAIAQGTAGAAGRGPATAEDIAAAIVFLCSERASYIAGATWPVGVGAIRVIV